jgi:NDP-sugar pyrophosphorylase family protein
VAKPALPVLGVPTLWFGAWHMARELGLKEIAINYSHAPETLRAAAADADLLAAAGVRFHFSDESAELLGSSGGLWKIRQWVGDSPLAVFNGDCIAMPGWKRVLKQHQRGKGLMTMHLRPHQDSKEAYTVVVADAHSRVTGFLPKAASGVMFTGASIVEGLALRRLPEGKSELMATLLKPLSDERQLFCAVEDGPWLDTGSPVTYADAHFNLMAALPAFRPLVEMKMREEAPGIWVPRHWPAGPWKAKVTGPVCFYGEYSQWKALLSDAKTQIGPRVVAMAPPPAGKNVMLNEIFFAGGSIPV